MLASPLFLPSDGLMSGLTAGLTLTEMLHSSISGERLGDLPAHDLGDPLFDPLKFCLTGFDRFLLISHLGNSRLQMGALHKSDQIGSGVAGLDDLAIVTVNECEPVLAVLPAITSRTRARNHRIFTVLKHLDRVFASAGFTLYQKFQIKFPPNLSRRDRPIRHFRRVMPACQSVGPIEGRRSPNQGRSTLSERNMGRRRGAMSRCEL